jgi:hypothetical protein
MEETTDGSTSSGELTALPSSIWKGRNAGSGGVEGGYMDGSRGMRRTTTTATRRQLCALIMISNGMTNEAELVTVIVARCMVERERREEVTRWAQM